MQTALWKEREEQERVEELSDLLEKFVSLCNIFRYAFSESKEKTLGFFYFAFSEAPGFGTKIVIVSIIYDHL